MAGESRNVERRDVKMGRYRFPGRPGKSANKRRINLSNCALPQHNDSSDAAEKICVGLSVFSQTFGDSALGTSDNFRGFSPFEVEEAMAEARLQQKEAEAEFKEQGISVNFWSDFQTELFSIFRVVPSKTLQPPKKTNVCFDGGGSASEVKSASNGESKKNSLKDASTEKIGTITNDEKAGAIAANVSPSSIRVNQHSLQRQAAKRLLKKAKQVNSPETPKSALQKKFILPSRSIRSSRVIKPTKRFLEDEQSLRAEEKIDAPSDEKVSSPETKIISEPSTSRGKVILREPRLQLERLPSSLGEGPFSSPSSASLVQNQHNKVTTVVCGVCGAVRFYKSIRQAKKFGILSCESCRKFISKMIRRGSSSDAGLKCLKGTGLCMVPAVVRNAQWNSPNLGHDERCKACWLKLCLRRYHIPSKDKQRLLGFLPIEMRSDSALLSVPDANHFNVPEKDSGIFKSFSAASEGGSPLKKTVEPAASEQTKKSRSSKEDKSGKRKGDSKGKRQRVPLAGPRVKHVCRSASVVLGQPLATYADKLLVDECCDKPQSSSPEALPPPSLPPPSLVEEAEPPKPPPEEPEVIKPPSVVAVKAPDRPQQIHCRKKKPEPTSTDLISLDFWEIYDPDEVCETGFSLTASQSFTTRALCYICGSAGLEKLVHCACCCEPYHEFCVTDSHMKSEGWRFDWVCPRCTICVTCGRASGQQLKCVRCENSYHTECVGGRLHHSPDRPWICSSCLRCKSCNAVDVSVFVGNLPLCKGCFVLRQKGNFCPLCQRCYEDDDYDCKMMECGQCKCWVHAKCEGVSDEKYQVLSFLPESVEFICRMCCAMPPAPWWLAVEAELRAGYLGVLKSLSKNRTACRMLRWSPRKACSCKRRESVKSHNEEDSTDSERRESPAPASDSGIGSADDELKSHPDEEDCFCFLEVDSYNSRSKPFSPNMLSIKKKVTTSEYSSITQFHEEMRSMVETTQSEELLEVYHSSIREVFPWFDAKCARVLGSSRGGSLENTPVKASPTKAVITQPCLVPTDILMGKGIEYFYSDDGIEDTRYCMLCKGVGDGSSDDSGRLLYCGQNEWVHCNCALWSGEVFEEIDGSLQNVHSAISRGRSIRCAHCQLKGASIGCCVRSCSENYHFSCARTAGCVFLDDKSVYCRTHTSESAGRLLQNEKDFEMRRPVYVDLDKRRGKQVEIGSVRLAVGGLVVNALGRFVPELSDLIQAIVPADFSATRLFWSSREPWRLVRYHFSVRCVEPEQVVGIDLGVNITVDHSKPDLKARMRQLRHFQVHHSLIPLEPTRPTKRLKRRIFDPLDEPDNQDLIPPDLQEAIWKELPHDLLDGISVQDLFQDIGEREREEEGGGEDDPSGHLRARKPGTLRNGNWNAKTDKPEKGEKWKRKPQEGKENKMVTWCARLLQVDGAVDSSSGSEAGESPGRSTDLPADIPQLDGADDSDYESLEGRVDTEEAPVKCSVCRCTYRTQRSYERHLESRCHDMLLSSSEDEEEAVAAAAPPPRPPDAKPPKPRTYSRKKTALVPAASASTLHTTAAAPSILMPPVILQEMSTFQPMVQYIMEPQKQIIVPNTYQVVLPPSPVMLSTPAPPPMFEMVADPRTGGMFLTQQQSQPVFYNMETIVSNTVMQTNQFVSSSYSQTSTQVFQASKLEQVVNVPTGYVLAPNDLICVPVPQALPAPSPVRPQWTPPKPKPVVKKQETPPRPSPPQAKPAARTPLVDFINNFAPDLPSPLPDASSVAPTPRRPPPSTAVRKAIPCSSMVRPPEPPAILAPTRKGPTTAVLRPTVTTCQSTTLPPPRKMYSGRATVGISMPSLDDSPPSNCDISLALSPSRRHNLPAPHLARSYSTRPPASGSSMLPSPSLSSVNKMPSNAALRPSTMPSLSPRSTGLGTHMQPLPAMVQSSPLKPSDRFHVPSTSSAFLKSQSNSSTVTSYTSPGSTRTESSLLISTDRTLQDSRSSYSITNNPPSPFLSPMQSLSQSPSSPCISSFTPPHPPPPRIHEAPLFSLSLPPLSPTKSTDKLSLFTPPKPSFSTTPNGRTPKSEVRMETSPAPLILHQTQATSSPKELQKLPCSPLQPVSQPQAPQLPSLPVSQDAKKSLAKPRCQVKEIRKELKLTPRVVEQEGPKLMYDVVSDDGFKFSSESLTEVWQKICESVQEVRAAYRMPSLPMASRSHEMLGMKNHGLQHALEQLPGVSLCKKYQPKYFKQPRSSDEDLTPVKENPSGCARSEGYSDRKEPDKFGWLASRFRKLPRAKSIVDDNAANRRTNNLPIAMRYRHLCESGKNDLFVYRSKIHGLGLFCMREIDAGEMVIEYSGELIRSALTDKREKHYTDRGIGCYMFRIDDFTVVDATMNGNAARFINHSCEPNCYSRVVDIFGKKHIVICALRRIAVMEELTYDYKFPFEDEKISCHCQSKKCRKYLN